MAAQRFCSTIVCSKRQLRFCPCPDHPRFSGTPEEGDFGLCTLRNPNIFSARGVWFTFIYRTQGHRAVGVLEKRSYRLSWVSPVLGSPLSRPLCLYYSTWRLDCQALFLKNPTFFSLDFRLHPCLSGLEPCDSWMAEWEPPHGMGLLKRYPRELLWVRSPPPLMRGRCRLGEPLVRLPYGTYYSRF